MALGRFARTASSILLASAFSAPVHGQLNWVDLGPGRLPDMRGSSNGRVSAIACDPKDSKIIYIGTPGGGVWKSTDGGGSWSPLTDAMLTLSIGSIAIDPSDRNVVYVGTGEANNAEHSGYGLGIYKSTDGGSTWVQLPRTGSDHDPSVFDGRCIPRIVVDPANSDHLFAALSLATDITFYGKGHQYGQSTAGVYESTNGGVTWTHIATTGSLSAWDVAHVDGGIFVAATQTGIFQTEDDGANWHLRSDSGTAVPRKTFAVAPAPNTNLIYLADAAGSGVAIRYSHDFGETWSSSSTPIVSLNCLGSGPQFAQTVTVDRTNPLIVYYGCVELHKATFNLDMTLNADVSLMPDDDTLHEDQHAATWDADGRLLIGNDGGVARAPDAGEVSPPVAWQHLDSETLGITQVLPGLSVDTGDSGRIYAGTQDNSGIRSNGSSRTWQTPAMVSFGRQVGDGGYTVIDDLNPANIVLGTPSSVSFYSHDHGATTTRVSPSGATAPAVGPPYAADPTLASNGGTGQLFYGANVFADYNYTTTFGVLSTMPTDCRIRGMAVAPRPCGTCDQMVYVALGHFLSLTSRSQNYSLLLASSDGGNSFYAPVAQPAGYMHWPRGTREIAVDANSPQIAFAVSSLWDNSVTPRARVWKTVDAGVHWTDCDGGASGGGTPAGKISNSPVNAVAIASMPGERRFVFAGTDQGLFLSFDDGASWRRYGTGLPNAYVYDVVVDRSQNRLLVGTMGRGIWSVPLPCLADIDDGTLSGRPDGVVDINDYNAFFYWLSHGGVSLDMNGDGDNGTDSDIELFMSHYLSGC